MNAQQQKIMEYALTGNGGLTERLGVLEGDAASVAVKWPQMVVAVFQLADSNHLIEASLLTQLKAMAVNLPEEGCVEALKERLSAFCQSVVGPVVMEDEVEEEDSKQAYVDGVPKIGRRLSILSNPPIHNIKPFPPTSAQIILPPPHRRNSMLDNNSEIKTQSLESRLFAHVDDGDDSLGCTTNNTNSTASMLTLDSTDGVITAPDPNRRSSLKTRRDSILALRAVTPDSVDDADEASLSEEETTHDFDSISELSVPVKLYINSLHYLAKLKDRLVEKPHLKLNFYLSAVDQMLVNLHHPQALADILEHYECHGALEDSHLAQLKATLIEIPLILYEYAQRADSLRNVAKSQQLMRYAANLLTPLRKADNQALLSDFLGDDNGTIKEQLDLFLYFVDRNEQIADASIGTLFENYQNQYFPTPEAGIPQLLMDSDFFKNILTSIAHFKAGVQPGWTEEEQANFIVEQLETIKAAIPPAVAGPMDFMLEHKFSLALTTQMLDTWFIALPQAIMECNKSEFPTVQFTHDQGETLSDEQVLDAFLQATSAVVWPQEHADLTRGVAEATEALPKAVAYQRWCSANQARMVYSMVTDRLYGENGLVASTDRFSSFNQWCDSLSHILSGDQLQALRSVFVKVGSKDTFYYDLSLHLRAVLPFEGDQQAQDIFNVHLLRQAVSTYREQLGAKKAPLEWMDQIERGLTLLRMLADLSAQAKVLEGAAVGGLDEERVAVTSLLNETIQYFKVGDEGFLDKWQQALVASDILTLKRLFLCLPQVASSAVSCSHGNFFTALSADSAHDAFLDNAALIEVLNRPIASLEATRRAWRDYEAVVSTLAEEAELVFQQPEPEPSASDNPSPSQTAAWLTYFDHIQRFIFEQEGLLAKWLNTPADTQVSARQWLEFIGAGLASLAVNDTKALLLTFDARELLMECVNAHSKTKSLSSNLETLQTKLLALFVSHYHIPSESIELAAIKEATSQKTQAWVESHAEQVQEAELKGFFLKLAALVDQYETVLFKKGSETEVQRCIKLMRAAVDQIATAATAGSVAQTHVMKPKMLAEFDHIFERAKANPNPLTTARDLQYFIKGLAMDFLDGSFARAYLATREEKDTVWQASMVSAWGNPIPPAAKSPVDLSLPKQSVSSTPSPVLHRKPQEASEAYTSVFKALWVIRGYLKEVDPAGENGRLFASPAVLSRIKQGGVAQFLQEIEALLTDFFSDSKQGFLQAKQAYASHHDLCQLIHDLGHLLIAIPLNKPDQSQALIQIFKANIDEEAYPFYVDQSQKDRCATWAASSSDMDAAAVTERYAQHFALVANHVASVFSVVVENTPVHQVDLDESLARKTPVKSTDHLLSSTCEENHIPIVQTDGYHHLGVPLSESAKQWHEAQAGHAKKMADDLFHSPTGGIVDVGVETGQVTLTTAHQATVQAFVGQDMVGLRASMKLTFPEGCDGSEAKKQHVKATCRALAQANALAFHTAQQQACKTGDGLDLAAFHLKLKQNLNLNAQSSKGHVVSKTDHYYARCLYSALRKLGFTHVHLEDNRPSVDAAHVLDSVKTSHHDERPRILGQSMRSQAANGGTLQHNEHTLTE